MSDSAVRLAVSDDLRRSRLTVFFRLLLALPHLVWLLLWTVAAVVVAVAAWIAALVSARAPQPLHRFLGAYVRYGVHLSAYLFLAANPFPAFTGAPGYPVDVEIDAPERQSRWKTAFRLLLALPALLLAGALVGGGGGGAGSPGREKDFLVTNVGVVAAVAFLGWFAALALGRTPRGFRDAAAYGIGYSAQAYAYLLLLTARYPNSDPEHVLPVAPAETHPVRLVVSDDLRRSRLTVFFRLLLALPHVVWLLLWGVVVLPAGVLLWLATLVTGRPPRPLHSFVRAYVRYTIHVSSFLALVANAFPAFTGAPGYVVDVEVGAPERQSRWKTAFRLVLALPALVVASSLASALLVVALLGWFAALATGRMPLGLRNLGAYALRYGAQASAYVLVLTDRYPQTAPVAPAAVPGDELQPAVA